jgi:uncharacterized protein
MNIEKKFIASSKGAIAAAIHYPETKTDKLAVLCSGFLDSKDYAHLVKLAEELAKRGYTAVRFDPTGTWESEGDISDYTATEYLIDVKNVLEYMLRAGDFRHILMGGHSKGGYIAMLYAAQDPRVNVVLGIMSPHSILSANDEKKLAEWKRIGYKLSFRDEIGRAGQREFRVPYSYVLDRQQYDVLKVIDRFHGVLILVAGEADDIVLPDTVKTIFKIANEPKRLIIMEGIGHDYRHNDKQVDLVNQRILEELDRL